MSYKNIKPGYYIVGNEADYMEAASNHWSLHGSESISSEIANWPLPESYPCLVIFSIVRDEADDEPYYLKSFKIYMSEAKALLDNVS